MWLRTSCNLSFTVTSPTPFILMLRPRSGAQQWVAREIYTLKPSVPAVEFTDGYGNLCQRLVAPPGEFSIHTSADVLTADDRSHMSAMEVNQRREGVCRDLAHLGIALCRGLCIPARMVVGYLHGLEPMDLHAWFEAYVGGRWYTFDATQAVPRGGRVTVAYGHDAADVAIFSQFGPALSPTLMQVTVELLDAAPD